MLTRLRHDIRNCHDHSGRGMLVEFTPDDLLQLLDDLLHALRLRVLGLPGNLGLHEDQRLVDPLV